jgi:hypothetical protein
VGEVPSISTLKTDAVNTDSLVAAFRRASPHRVFRARHERMDLLPLRRFFQTRLIRPFFKTLAVGMAAVCFHPLAAYAQGTTLPPITVGAGVQTSYVHDDPDGGASTDLSPRKNNETSRVGCSRSAFQSVFVMQPSEDRA